VRTHGEGAGEGPRRGARRRSRYIQGLRFR
jgi:hypothetical protein